jgi:hypothetical protein
MSAFRIGICFGFNFDFRVFYRRHAFGTRIASVLHMHTRQRMYKTALLLAILTSCAHSLAQPSPTNDDFANRTVLTGSSINFSSTLVGSTLESSETDGSVPPGPFSTGGSVWWTWTTPQSTTVTIAILRDNPSVNVTGTSLYIYSGTNITSLTLLDVSSFDSPSGRYVAFPATAGVSYQFRVAGTWNRPFALQLTATNAPVFLVQPQDCAVSPYGSAFFSTIASGLPTGNWQRPAAAYQWKFNGSPIPDQTAPSLLIHNVTTNETGSYSVIASNAGGLTESAAANLTLINTNPIPRLAALSPTGLTSVSFALTGEAGRWYAIESSSNLLNWGTSIANKIWSTNTVWVKATNSTDFLSVRRLGPVHFVRASLNGPTDVCVAQLKQLLWAQYMSAIERRLSASSSINLGDLKPYLPLTSYNLIKPCPQGGTYSAPPTIVDNPTCSVQARGHVIASP